MKYKLIKDIPTAKAGTIFECKELNSMRGIELIE
jgi:hypothetical protein